jgi:uncharacterized protein YndB with AHSA1/START domain
MDAAPAAAYGIPMRLTLEQSLPASPSAVWPFVTDPARMNAWSLARIDPVSPGDGADPGGVGALRRITVRARGRDVSFEEVIEHADHGSRLVYRVVRGLPVRAHRGEITLAREGGGARTRLRWDVDFSFLLPGVGAAARRVLDGQLRRSLTALADAVRGAPEIEPVSARFTDDLEDLAGLEREAERVLGEQRALADRLARARDPKYWFTRVYQYVTEAQLDGCREGTVTHRAWVLRLIPRFHAYYTENLRRWLGELPGAAESHWQVAFRAMERGGEGQPGAGASTVRGLLFGVAAHIEDDLPRALAEVYRRHYAGRCAYVRFRADYLLMAGVFQRASERLVAEMPRGFLPLYLRVLSPMLPAEVQDQILNRYYDVPRRRRQAFERGERLSAWAG